MPESGGARAEIRALGRTSDPSVMTIGSGGRVIVQMHEDNLQFLEMFPLENRSDKMFDPGPGAIEIPLPKGFVSAEAQESDRKIDVRQNHGMAVHGAFSPQRAILGTTAKNAGQEVVFGFVLPYHGDTRAFSQPMPNGIGTFTLITEQIPGLTVSGPGIGERQERELGGRKYWVMPGEPIAPGGVLEFTLNGLPSTDSTGRTVAGVLTLMLIAGAFVFGRRPKGGARGGDVADERDRLVDKRESTFAELLALERGARDERGDAARRPAQAAGHAARADLPRHRGAGRTPAGMTDVGAAPLRLSKVGKIYDGRRALADVSTTFEPGRIAAVLGPNGAGKSTLLGILSTLIAPSAGEVRWGDERLGRGSSLRARIGYVGTRAGPLRRSDGHREPHAVRFALRRARSGGARGGAARAGGAR